MDGFDREPDICRQNAEAGVVEMPPRAGALFRRDVRAGGHDVGALRVLAGQHSRAIGMRQPVSMAGLMRGGPANGKGPAFHCGIRAVQRTAWSAGYLLIRQRPNTCIVGTDRIPGIDLLRLTV